MARLVPLLAVLAAAAAGVAQAAPACQPLTVGVNTFKGVLHEFPAGAGTQFVLQLDRPLCQAGAAMVVEGAASAHLEGRMLALAFPEGDARRFVGRRVLVSGALSPAKAPADGAVLQVGSFAPLPQVAADVI